MVTITRPVHVLRAVAEPTDNDKTRMVIHLVLSRALSQAEWEWLTERWRSVNGRPTLASPATKKLTIGEGWKEQGARWVGELIDMLKLLPGAAEPIVQKHRNRDAAWDEAVSAVAAVVEKSNPTTD